MTDLQHATQAPDVSLETTRPTPKRCCGLKAGRLIPLMLVLLFGVGLDRVTKIVAADQLKGATTQTFAGDVFRLQYAENSGGFLSLGGTLPRETRFWILTVANAVFLAVLTLVVLYKSELPRVSFYALAMIIAGGVGNLIDRVVFDGYVVDFLNMGIGPIRTGIFNVADMAITGGVIVLFLMSWKDDSKPSATSPATPPQA